MLDAAQPAVYRLWGMGNTPAMHGRKQLHAQTNTEDRDICGDVEKSGAESCAGKR